MKTHHIAVYVRDLEKTRGFYEKYFRAKANVLLYLIGLFSNLL